MCSGYKGRVWWRQREGWPWLEHLLPLQHHPSVAASKQESAGLVRGTIYSSTHKNLSRLIWLFTLLFFHRDVLQLFKCKNRVPPWVFQSSKKKTKQANTLKPISVDWYINLCMCARALSPILQWGPAGGVPFRVSTWNPSSESCGTCPVFINILPFCNTQTGHERTG